ncbi:PREDICTED: 26S proteasome non-ATPase regulatory subunit 3-like [Priapulus caudatus]|uniref:26S proteasome non-ATPase regulatory subunit 3-like n=1 Tax=Priapulus caudatus TaxID=37621 RepID=A0ABM1E1N8_PRICU|nr:PREDICTED: 26S proteasome non-ATPase regulatory subunit 3-like [Priapulus caudatus]
MAKDTKADVEMKDASSPPTVTEKEGSETETKRDPDLLTVEDIKEHAKVIEKGVNTKEPRFVLRVIRALLPTRRRLNHNVLRRVIIGFFPPTSEMKDMLLAFIEEPMEADGPVAPLRPKSIRSQPLLPEVEVYIHLLVLVYLIDGKKYELAVKCSTSLTEKVVSYNRRTLDSLAAKCFFYYSRAHELTGQLSTIRSFLHARLRTSTLRHDDEGVSCLLNLLLRNYLHYKLYDQADKLVSKSTFPENANNNEWARYLYYLGRIKATQLEYSEAHKNLLQAVRKAPTTNAAAGFKQTVHKLAITVELLLGDIPDRAVFRETMLRKTLQPYFQLTQAVRAGDLSRFNEVLCNFSAQFQADDTYTLIVRLRHNVIKTGVRMINVSYSRISLADIAQKLQVDSPQDAEYIVAKAIRDGVIEATINHMKGYMQSKDNIDIYCTREPQAAFHQRISFCLDIHNHSVKAMRYPPKSYNKDLESAEERRQREQEDLEMAKELAEEDDEAF